MKKIISFVMFVAITVIACFGMSSCTYEVYDLTWDYNYAIIELQNGKIIEGEIAGWRDYEDGEQLQITMKDGTIYLTCSMNCTLIKKVK